MKSFDSSSSMKANTLQASPSMGLKTGKPLQAYPSMGFRSGKSLQASSSMALRPPPSDGPQSNENEAANHRNVKRSSSLHVACYSLMDLQTATGNFATGRLLGEGSIGRVYRAKYADGRVCNKQSTCLSILLFRCPIL